MSSPGDGPASQTDLLARLARHAPRESRYAEGRKIAEGGMGAILEVFDPDLRRSLAMKVIREDRRERTAAAPDPDEASRARQALARFLEEAQVTAQLSHPGVVPVHELGVDERGGVYFTMALVRGEDLQKVFEHVRAAREGWSVTRALGVLLRACETLAFAHSKGVVHRDLKPANVMVGEFGEVYVMDWGLAKIAGGAGAPDARLAPEVVAQVSSERSAADEGSSLHTLAGTIVGTPAFMSPEQARGEELDARSDVYAMGAMLYALLAGRPPYAPAHGALGPFEFVRAIWKGPPLALDRVARDVPAELAAICDKAMTREPERRYATMRELAQDLQSYLEDRVVRAHRTGPWAEFRKWVRRNRGLAGALAGLLLAVLAGAGVTAEVQRRRAESEAELGTRIRGLSDITAHAGLVEREEAQTWPAIPARQAGMEAWLDTARALHGRIGYHRESLERLAAGVTSDEDRWLHDRFEALIGTLEELPERIAAAEARLETARTLAERTVSGPDARRRWDEAIAGIAGSPKYDGLRIAPQLGLLPLGADGGSGLWEFAHLLSGEEARLDAKERRRVLDEASGIVLVLIPGGTFTMGSRDVAEAGRDATFADPFRQDDEVLFEDVELDAFFASKYETTQVQWERLFGRNPSQHDRPPHGGPLHPVEAVSRRDVEDAARRWALQVPTEVQWERLARAETTTPWSFGPDYLDFDRHGNCADANAATSGAVEARICDVDLDDGFVGHAPVGTFRPNPYGLFDVHGNVWEWCRDAFLIGRVPPPGDGFLGEPWTSGEGTIRGGGWTCSARECRSANRFNFNVSNTDGDLGVRFVRAVE